MSTTSNTVELIFKARDETANAVDGFIHRLDGIHERIRAIGNIALGNLVGAAAFRGLDDLTKGVVEFGKSLVEANAEMETTKLRLNILYQSATEGAQAFAFIKQNELTSPFDIASIMDASTRLVAFKQDIVSLLPAVENIAGAMGQPLGRVARAFDAALAGRFAMLRNIGISKDALAQAGATFDKGGHLTDPSSLARAFIEMSNTTFKGGANKMAQTWTGLMSSMSSQWFYFKANLGQGAFDVLEKQLSGLVHALQNPANTAAIQQFEGMLGAGLAQATVAAINFGRTIGPYIGSAIVFAARAWPILESAVSTAFNFVGGVVAAFANWLQTTGFPAIQKVLNAVAGWWSQHANTIKNFLSTMGDDISTFVTYVSTNMGTIMTGVGGAFEIGMGAATAIFGGALDLISGNWTKFQKDMANGSNLIATGFVDLMAAGSTALLPIGKMLIDGFDYVWHHQHEIIDGVGSLFSALVATAAMTLAPIFDPLIAGFNLVVNAVKDILARIPTHIDLPFGKSFDIPGMDKIKGIMNSLHDIPLNPATQWKGIFDTNQALIDHFAPADPSKNLHIVAGKTNAQAAADIEAQRQKILKDAGLLGLSPGKPSQFDTDKGPGLDIVNQIKALFKGIGGKMTFADFLKELGLKDLGKGHMAFDNSTLIPSSLPVLGAPPEPSTTPELGSFGIHQVAGLRDFNGVVSKIAQDATASLAGQRAVTGRVPLGALGATFMQTVATTGPLSSGGNPAVKAAQQQLTEQQAQTKQGEQGNTLLSRAVEAINRTNALLEALTKPPVSPTPPNPLQSRGVLRPRLS